MDKHDGHPANADGLSSQAMEWRDVVGYEGIYLVSEMGNIRALPRKVTCILPTSKTPHTQTFRERLITSFPDQCGYPAVNLSRDGKPKRFNVHRIVCEAFHGSAPPNHEVAHLDGNRKNSQASNLKWATKIENEGHKRLHGTSPKGKARRHG